MVGDKVAKNKGVFFVIFATYPYQNTTWLYSIKNNRPLDWSKSSGYFHLTKRSFYSTQKTFFRKVTVLPLHRTDYFPAEQSPVPAEAEA